MQKVLAPLYKTTTSTFLLQNPEKSPEKTKQDAIVVLGHQPCDLYSTKLIHSLSTTKCRSTLGISVCTLLLNVYLTSLLSSEMIFWYFLHNWVPELAALKSFEICSFEIQIRVSDLALCSLLFNFSVIYSNYSYFMETKEHLIKLKCK